METPGGHHLATEPGWGQKDPALQPASVERRGRLTPTPRAVPFLGTDAALAAFTAKEQTGALCSSTSAHSWLEGKRRPGEAGPCSRSHRTQGPEVGSQDSGCPLVPLGSHCLPSTAVVRCQELQSWPLSKTSPAPLNSERSPPGSDCREHSCRPLLSPQASAPRSGFLLSQSGPGEGQVEDTYTKVLSFPLLSFQRKELEGPESSWKAAHLTLSNFFFCHRLNLHIKP